MEDKDANGTSVDDVRVPPTSGTSLKVEEERPLLLAASSSDVDLKADRDSAAERAEQKGDATAQNDQDTKPSKEEDCSMDKGEEKNGSMSDGKEDVLVTAVDSDVKSSDLVSKDVEKSEATSSSVKGDEVSSGDVNKDKQESSDLNKSEPAESDKPNTPDLTSMKGRDWDGEELMRGYVPIPRPRLLATPPTATGPPPGAKFFKKVTRHAILEIEYENPFEDFKFFSLVGIDKRPITLKDVPAEYRPYEGCIFVSS